MEIYFALTSVFVQMQCPKCKAGYMIQTGKVMDWGPVKSYAHMCDNKTCMHHVYVRGLQYPHYRQVIDPQPMDPQPTFEGPIMNLNPVNDK